jgi:aspartyl-tRNA(Asn)/glutamyl-tRNA(Gln) amidotransferase subunit C
MKVSKELLGRVATNARLTLTEEELERLLPQLEEILKAFAELDKVDTRDVPPSFHPIALKPVVRADHLGQCLTTEAALSLTPHKRANFFRGPKVV